MLPCLVTSVLGVSGCYRALKPVYWVLVGVTMSGDQYTECYCVCGQSVVHRVLASVSGCGGGGGGGGGGVVVQRSG